jgi:hypothetical protein
MVVHNLQKKCERVESESIRLDSFHHDVQLTEQEVLKQMIKEMDQLQSDLLSVWQSRKLCLIEQANRFYREKTK